MASQPVPTMRAPYATRGYHAVYREREVNHCPSCGQTNWLIGRVSAECARCATAMPLSESVQDTSGWRVSSAHEPRAVHHRDLRAV